MNRLLFIPIISLWTNIYSQNLPSDFKLLEPIVKENHVDSVIFDYKEFDSGTFNQYQKPFLLFYSFLGCRGCVQVMKMTLNPNYASWQKELGLDIYCILRYMPDNQYATTKKYYETPYPIFLDLSDYYFNNTSKYVEEDKWKDARPRLLLVTKTGQVKFIPLEYYIPADRLKTYLIENL